MYHHVEDGGTWQHRVGTVTSRPRKFCVCCEKPASLLSFSRSCSLSSSGTTGLAKWSFTCGHEGSTRSITRAVPTDLTRISLAEGGCCESRKHVPAFVRTRMDPGCDASYALM